MSEPTPTWSDQTPTYTAQQHFAAVGRALAILVGFSPDERPSASAILIALRRQGAALQTSQIHD